MASAPKNDDDQSRSHKVSRSKTSRRKTRADHAPRISHREQTPRASQREVSGKLPPSANRKQTVVAQIIRRPKERESLRTKNEENTPSSLAPETARCMHQWPTPADLARYAGRMPNEQEAPSKTTEIDFYYARMPTWFIEEKMLKHPGDYLLTRNENNDFVLSVKSHEKGNPVVHLQIAWEETKQIRGDRNKYYRVKGTVLQNSTVFGLIQAYRKSMVNALKQNTSREVQLLNPVLPCQGCLYTKSEYYLQWLLIRDLSELQMGDKIYENPQRKVFKATRTLRDKALLVDVPRTKQVVVYEYSDKSAEKLDAIYRELHIVHTVRFKLGWDTALKVEGIMACPNRPLYVVYKYCEYGSLKQYLIQHRERLAYAERLFILCDLACTLYQMIALGVLHCNLRAKNIFVDRKEREKPPRMAYYIGGFQHATMVKKGEPLAKKVDPKKVHSARWQAPDVHKTGVFNEATEVYSFGMLMFEVLTVELPFKEIPKDQIANAIISNPDKRPEIPDTIPEETAKLMQKCWHMDPAKRPTTKDLWRTMRDICARTPNAA